MNNFSVKIYYIQKVHYIHLGTVVCTHPAEYIYIYIYIYIFYV